MFRFYFLVSCFIKSIFKISLSISPLYVLLFLIILSPPIFFSHSSFGHYTLLLLFLLLHSFFLSFLSISLPHSFLLPTLFPSSFPLSIQSSFLVIFLSLKNFHTNWNKRRKDLPQRSIPFGKFFLVKEFLF